VDDFFTRAATVEPSSYNAERGTVEVVFSTGADVARRDLGGAYVERLRMDHGAWNLSQLIGGPVLDSHRRDSVRDVIGTVEAASIQNGRATATIRFSDRDDVAGIRRDIHTGILNSVSVGYEASYREFLENNHRVREATSIVPREISVTPLGADPQARVRSEEVMNEHTHNQIRAIAAAVQVPAAFADNLIQSNVSVDEARRAIIQEAARGVPRIDNRAPTVVTRDGNDGLIGRMADGLLARMNPAHQPTEGREFTTYTLAGIARRCLQERGLSTTGTSPDILTRAMHTTSDFSAILAEVFNKSLLVLRTAPSPITQVFQHATVNDFRAKHVLEISDGPGLSKLNQNGEIAYGTITGKELASYKIDTYAKAFSISFRTLVNDDVNALADISAKMTRGARQWFNGFLVDTIIANPKLGDNKAVFHADHGNLAAAGAAPSDTTIGAGKLAMRTQKDASGNPVDAPPRFIVIPAALEMTVDKLLAQIYPAQPDDAIVAVRGLTPIAEPRFDAKGQTGAWYLFADPAAAPVFEYAELSGYAGPQVETRQGFETVGTEIRVVWHVGAGAVDSRGAWKNPGA
jgi:hypothetical protein